jgi:hypothetical protein
MILVAIFSIAIGLSVEARRLLRRRERFLALEEAHASRRYDFGEGRYDRCFRDEDREDGMLKPDFVKHLDALRDHFAKLEQKYRYAASHPWLDLAPDPPAPEYRFDGKERGHL